MEKKLYKLTINDSLERVMPPLQDDEIERLTKKLLEEGCRDALVVWDGVIVDGHNRYRICHEHGIPFSYVERSFESEEAAKLWIIDTQLGRRNLTDFERCEMALQYEEKLKAEARERKKRKAAESVVPNLAQQNRGRTRDELARMAGVSHGTLDKVKTIVQDADEATKEQLRTGEVSINRVYTSLTGKKPAQKPVKPSDGSATITSDIGASKDVSNFQIKNTTIPGESPVQDSLLPTATVDQTFNPEGPPDKSPKKDRYEIVPGFDMERALGALADVKYQRPPDSVYEAEPIEVFGGMPSNDQAMRGNAEMIQARWEIEKCNKHYLQMIQDVLRKMSRASRNEENMQELRTMVMACCEQAAASLTTG